MAKIIFFGNEQLAQGIKAKTPIFFTKNNAEILEIIQKYKPEIGVLAAFGKIIKDEVIEAFPCGILNIHPSLLPKYRGTTPIESALLNNDSETGVSVMRLAHDMDAGNILAQTTVQITPETTKQSLYES